MTNPPYHTLVSTDSHTQLVPALGELLKNQDVNSIVMAYGYMTISEEIKRDWNQIKSWLSADSSRKLEIYMGVWDKDKDCLKSSVWKYLLSTFGVKSFRCGNVALYGIRNLHTKIICIGKSRPQDNALSTICDIEVVEAIVGSSNFTDASRYGDRIEIDLHLTRTHIANTDFTVKINDLRKWMLCELQCEMTEMPFYRDALSDEHKTRGQAEQKSRDESWDAQEIGERAERES